MYDYPDYEDFYEPSEFEMQIEEFKNTLKQSVSKEWIDKMNTLEKENAELQEVKKNFESIKRDYEYKKNECERKAETAIKNAEYDARHLRLKELMQDVQYTYFRAQSAYKYGLKCNKCDEKRRIHYKTPSGKNANEQCECAARIKILVPEEMVIHELSLRDKDSKRINVWFTQHKSSYDVDCYYTPIDYLADKTVVENDEDVTKLNVEKERDLYFRTKEKCQEYCNWYNENILGVKAQELFDE